MAGRSVPEEEGRSRGPSAHAQWFDPSGDAFQHPYRWLLLLFVANVLLRLPGVLQEWPPIPVCDEDMYTRSPFGMYKSGTWRPTDFLAGGMNFYPSLVLARLWTALIGHDLTYSQFLGLTRALGPILINSSAALFVVAAVARLDRRPVAIVAAAIIATLSPLVLGVSRHFYPDHYVIGPAAALIYICVLIGKDEAKPVHFIAAGVLVAIAASIKYSAGYLVLAVAGTYLTANITRGLRIVIDTRIWLAGLAAIITFALLNIHGVLDYRQIIKALQWHQDHYTKGHPGLEADDGHLFYVKILCLTFGVAAMAPLALGVMAWLWNAPRVAIPLLATALLLLMMLGNYPVVVNRNMMPILPIVMIGIALGCATLFAATHQILPKSAWALAPLALILLAEPLWRNGASLRNDFQPDSRLAAREWVSQNIPAGTPVGISNACWSVPLDPGHNPIVHLAYPASVPLPFPAPPPPCVDVYVMDDWFYEHLGFGKNPLSWAVVSEHAYINPGRKRYVDARVAQNGFLASYKPIKIFSERNYYGPKVTIYQRNESCPKPN